MVRLVVVTAMMALAARSMATARRVTEVESVLEMMTRELAGSYY